MCESLSRKPPIASQASLGVKEQVRSEKHMRNKQGNNVTAKEAEMFKLKNNTQKENNNKRWRG